MRRGFLGRNGPVALNHPDERLRMESWALTHLEGECDEKGFWLIVLFDLSHWRHDLSWPPMMLQRWRRHLSCSHTTRRVVTLKDGGMLYGEVVEMSDGVLYIKTAAAVDNLVKIKWANVGS